VIIIFAGAIWLLFAPEHGDGLASIIVLLILAIAGVLFMVHAVKDGVQQINEAPQPSAPLAAQPAPAVAPIYAEAQTGEDKFAQWVRHRLVYSPADSVTASDALNDYNLMCHGTGVQPVTPVKFGQLLTAWQEASGGRVSKTKSDGVIVYRGVRIASGL
jgi:hypothetical protein